MHTRLWEMRKRIASHFSLVESTPECSSSTLLLDILAREKSIDPTTYLKQAISGFSEISELISHLVQKQLDILIELSKSQIPIAFWQHKGNAQPLWAAYDVLTINEEFRSLWFVQDELNVFSNIERYWHLPDGQEFQLQFVQLLVACDYPLNRRIPKSIKRMAVPHAMYRPEIVREHFCLSRYGFSFDYFLSPVPLNQSNIPKPLHLPADCILHSSNEFTIIPAGYSSFDKLYRLSSNVPLEHKKYIIFQLTTKLHLDFTDDEIDVVLMTLCDAFTDYTILFRPWISESVKVPLSSQKSNFEYDKSQSYHKKYSQARVYISHALHPSDTYRTFSLATGIPPILHCFKPRPNGIHDVPVIYSNNIQELVQAVHTVLSNPHLYRTKLEDLRQQYVANPGRTAEHFPIYVKSAINSQPIPGSMSVPVVEIPKEIPVELQWLIAFCSLSNSNARNRIAEMIKNENRSSASFNFFAFLSNSNESFKLLYRSNEPFVFVKHLLGFLLRAANSINANTPDPWRKLIAKHMATDGAYLWTMFIQECDDEELLSATRQTYYSALRNPYLSKYVLQHSKMAMLASDTHNKDIIKLAAPLFPEESKTVISKYMAEGDYDTALRLTNSYLEGFPSDAELHNVAGFCYLKINQPDAALSSWIISIMCKPQDSLWSRILPLLESEPEPSRFLNWAQSCPDRLPQEKRYRVRLKKLCVLKKIPIGSLL